MWEATKVRWPIGRNAGPLLAETGKHQRRVGEDFLVQPSIASANERIVNDRDSSGP
jgi:hypothetical protein